VRGAHEDRAVTRTNAIVLETFGEFWCEAAVLVAVFGLLERIMKYEELTVACTVATIGCATLFLGVGIVLETWSRS
jgi:hypothetical protein